MTTLSKLLIVFIISVTTSALAQEFQGVATYKSHRKVDLKMDKEHSDAMQKQIEAQLRKQFQQEYTLKFTKNESIYKKNESLATPNPAAANGLQINVIQGSDVFYKNVQEKRYTNETEIFGKQFLIKDSLRNRGWELLQDTKNIGLYTCYKAQFKKEITEKTMSSNGEFETITKERITTAWYTPQIPVSNGPDDFQGLPGLILEINDGKLTLVCTKIVLNPKESITIKEPTKGKQVTQQEFDDIMDKKQQEMMERMHSRQKDGDNVIIKIGG